MTRRIAIGLLIAFAGVAVMIAATLPQGIAKATTSPTTAAPACPIPPAALVASPAPESPVSNRKLPNRLWWLGGGGLIIGLGVGYFAGALRHAARANSRRVNKSGEVHAAPIDADTEKTRKFMDALASETSFPQVDASSKDNQTGLGDGSVHSGKLVKHVDDEPQGSDDK